jgi:hypothetical protein
LRGSRLPRGLPVCLMDVYHSVIDRVSSASTLACLAVMKKHPHWGVSHRQN